MSPQQFRKIALSLPGTVESEHGGHPDFRFGGKIFASLGVPSSEWAMVKLTPEQQRTYCVANAEVFRPCSGAWGRQGYTNVKLASARTAEVRSALALAVENVAASATRKRTVTPSSPAGRYSPAAVSPSVSTTEFSDSEAVSAFLRDLEHPLKPMLEGIRAAILKADRRITEGLKWNAPSFYCHGWFATFHLRSKAGVVLVLHHGAKAHNDSTSRNTINDSGQLLTWASADRATITFTNANDFKAKCAALKSIIKQWVEFQLTRTASASSQKLAGGSVAAG